MFFLGFFIGGNLLYDFQRFIRFISEKILTKLQETPIFQPMKMNLNVETLYLLC